VGKGLTRKFKQEEKREGSPIIRKKMRELKIEILILTGLGVLNMVL